MQVICPQCATRLQLSAPKLPDHPFTIKCPKCQQGITVSPAVAPPPPTPATPGAAADPLDLSDTSAPDNQPETAPTLPSFMTTPPEPPPRTDIFAAPPEPPVHSLLPEPSKSSLSPPPPASDVPTSETNLAIGWTNSMPSPTVSDDSTTLFTSHSPNHDLLQALTTLLSSNGLAAPVARLEQNRRRSVVTCLANAEDTKKVADVLDSKEYDVIAAASPEQVTTMLQTSHQLDVLLLDPNFHAGQKGGAMIMRYLNMLNPARRRRVFVVVTSHSYRTLDMQAAFVHGVNMILNSNDLEALPQALAKSIGDFNELYRAFNQVNGVNAF